MIKNLKVLTVGGAMVDTIAIVESRHIERMLMKNAAESYLLLAEGSKTEATKISTHAGGGAVNAAVAFARLGADAAPLIVIGRDPRGETILARLLEEGVSIRWVMRDERAATGASVLVSSHESNAAIFTFRGANGFLEPQHLRPDAFAVDVVYISGLSNKSADRFPELLRLARSAGAFVATNPGTRQLSSRGDIVRSTLGNIDMLTVNRAEADTMVPQLVRDIGDGGSAFADDGLGELPILAVRGLQGGGYELSLRAFFAALIGLGTRRVVITDGRDGAFLADNMSIYHCPVLSVEIAGTAGAGDAFGATLAACLASGMDPARALRAATVNAASVVSQVDTQSGLLRGAPLMAELEKRTAELTVRQWRL